MLATGLANRAVMAQEALVASRFALVEQGIEIASFTELEALVSELETIEFETADESGPVFGRDSARILPQTLTLKRPMDKSINLWTWHHVARYGGSSAAARNVTMIVYPKDGKPVAQYELIGAWPLKIELRPAPDLPGGLIEAVTFMTDSLQRLAL